ncbi:MAG: sulfatase-like hydrolase/transferase [Erysipelotrichaceae bacterium]|nr:sulfatase-like hydrolase/transferase [Erysipelotrichaceae bacterium]
MTRPNILFITTDQQRFDTLNCAGYPHMKTPNLDTLASEGCLFTHAYSNNPVCLPARHNIISGLGCRHHTFDDNYFDDSHQIPYQLPTFAQILTDNGYSSIAIGKLHFQPYRRHNGFERLLLMDEIPRFREDDDYAMYLKNNGFDYLQSVHGVRHMLYMQPQQSLVGEEHHGSTWVADRTIDFLKNKSKNRPFLIWAGFIHPHPPFDIPESYAHLYDDVDIPEPYVSNTPLSTLAEENKNIADYPNKETLMRARRAYYSAVSFVDTQVGRIIQTLKDIGEYDNTLIVFTSDHGEMMGDYGTYQKFLPYDGSAHIPMIMRWPEKIKPGTKRDEFVDLNDLFPTFVDVAGLEMPKEYDYPGASVFKDTKDRDHQFIEHQHGARRWISMQNRQYKYNYYYGGAKEELFDMVNDPHETTNLLVNEYEKYDEIRKELRQRLLEAEERYGLEGMTENHEFRYFDDFEPFFYRENNPPQFRNNLTRAEDIDKLWTLEHELEEAIRNEPVVDLNKLDKQYFDKTLNLEEIEAIQARRNNK